MLIVYSLYKIAYVIITGFLALLFLINLLRHQELEKKILNAILLLPFVLRMLLIK